MAKIYNYDVMFDDTSIDVSKEVALVWSIANSLRGAYCRRSPSVFEGP